MTLKEPQCQVASWLERLQEYNLDIEPQKRKNRCNVDALFRIPMKTKLVQLSLGH